MCILCVVPRWSRKIATLLPWLLFPVLLFWGMSPLLPPRLRFEVTSPRIACLTVLVLTLVWYKALVPLLNYLQACMAARERERQRALAIDMQTLLKTAIRRCRNCHTPYRDQNPTGGRFKCSYCGQFSKRPILDLPCSVRSSSFSELMRSCGWIWSQDRQAQRNTNWSCSTVAKFSSFLIFFPFNLIFYLFVSMRWLCRVVFRNSSSDDGSDTDHKGALYKSEDDGGNLHERRWEKTRRKAEEKRQTKMEKEMLEEEERKQREEVAKLIEERRKMRDEKLKAEGETSKGSIVDEERDSNKHGKKRRKDRRNDKDRGSSKSNSDVEDLEKRVSNMNERKYGFYNKNRNERHDAMRNPAVMSKAHALDTSHGNKMVTGKTRYSSHITGNFSSRGFDGSIFFGRNTQNPTSVVKKPIKPVTVFMNHTFKNVRKSQVAGDVSVNTMSSGDSSFLKGNLHQPMNSSVQPRQATLKKPWHQLFTNPAPTNPATTSTSRNNNSEVEAQITDLNNQKLRSDNFCDSQTNFAQPFPLTSMTSSSFLFSSTSPKSLSVESLFTSIKDSTSSFTSEEAENFEDPCYVPDIISLLGPVSEELDNFPLDTSSDFLCNDKVVESQVLKSPSASGIISKPSPIECPISRLQNSEEKQTSFGQVSCNKSQDLHMTNVDESQGIWQMWEPPLDQNIGLLGGPSRWLSTIGHQNPEQEDILNIFSNNSLISQSMKGSPALLSAKSPQHVLGGIQQNGVTHGANSAAMNGSDPWMQIRPLQSLASDEENHLLPLSLIDNMQQNDAMIISPNKSKHDCSIVSPISWLSSKIFRSNWYHNLIPWLMVYLIPSSCARRSKLYPLFSDLTSTNRQRDFIGSSETQMFSGELTILVLLKLYYQQSGVCLTRVDAELI
ncbi:uncharacterized protein LOC122037508 [Zingiber officinale]|uniref:uncharacterized protein LOC122037508 n=1 Tax=Zingiber officinale TaxID=94328 RepID=UPI001C4CF56F|nr:uncharacterized protein LOC122037508 [Zingiber officinale]